MVGGINVPYDYKKYGTIAAYSQGEFCLRGDFPIYDEDGYRILWIAFIPIPGQNGIKDQEKFSLYLYDLFYAEEFFNGLRLSLRWQGKDYPAVRQEKKDVVRRMQFGFPITIQEIKQHGAVLIVDYKNFHKEIPLKYVLQDYKYMAY